MGLTVLGFAIRVAGFNQSIIADELSTYWIIKGHSLGDVLSSVRSDDEITPPLYFVLAWLSTKLGSNPDLVRLPSLVAGTATIPLVYMLGARTVGRSAGLIGATIFTLSPFMIYYSTEARAYAVMLVLLTASTLALLTAVEGGRARWWVVYAVCSCGALLSHYTAAFPLAAQFAWALWAHRDALRPLLLSNVGVLIGFAPWIPGFIADNNSPTTEILARLSPFTLDYARTAVENWAIGFPYVDVSSLPGTFAVILLISGLAIALLAGTVRAADAVRASRPGLGGLWRRIPPGAVLIVLLALAAPIGEAVYSAVGGDVFGARNLNASWPGLALGVGALLTAAGPLAGFIATALVLSGYALGAAKMLEADFARYDYHAAAETIQERWQPGDVVVDIPGSTPVPLTGLDVYLPQDHLEFRLGIPSTTDHPFTIADAVPPAAEVITEAMRVARGTFDLSRPPRAPGLHPFGGGHRQ